MELHFVAARQTEEDAAIVLEWRNDPVSRRNSYHGELRALDSFWPEYRDRYFVDPELPPLFALVREARIAFLRFARYELAKEEGQFIDISINLAPEWRGKGAGAEILSRVTTDMLDRCDGVVAEIKKFNTASMRAFEKAGYQQVDETVKHVADTGESVPIYRYIRRADGTS